MQAADGDLSNCSMVIAMKSVLNGIQIIQADTQKQRAFLKTTTYEGRFPKLPSEIVEASRSEFMRSNFRDVNVCRK